MTSNSVKIFKIIFWLIIVLLYPMLISIYVTLPLFIGFAGLMFIIGIEKDKLIYTLFATLYMLNLEINLSLPLFLLLISTTIFYIFLNNKLHFLKLCRVCVYVLTVVSINLIYFFVLTLYDIVTHQHSINYDGLIAISIIYDIIAAVLL